MKKARLKEMMSRICAIVDEYDQEGLGLLLQISNTEETCFLLEGSIETVIEGLVNTADQRKDVKAILLEVMEILAKVDKDKNSVENLINRALGYKSRKDMN